MRTRSFVAVVVVASILGCAAAQAENEDAAREFANGRALLAKADLQGALAAFKAAVKADPENTEYFQYYGLLQRVLKLRAAINEEKDADAWQQMARALYSFYWQYKVYNEALPLARNMYEKTSTGEAAGLVADTLVALNKNDEAATLLSGLDADKATPHTLTVKALALAHLGKLDEAKAAAAKVEIPKDCDADICFDAARLYALIGDNGKAIGMLTCAFETTPAGQQLDTAKADAKACPDLAKVATTPEFAKALEAQGKAATGCGSKAACGKCPMKDKGTCSEKGKEGGAKDGKEAGCEHDKKAGKE